MTKGKVTRIFDILERQESRFPRKDALSKRRDNGNWETFSTKEFVEHANQLSCGFLELGLKKGDKVATISYNQPEWNFVDFGMLQAGIVHVPLYSTLGKREIAYILNDSETKVIFAENEELADRILAVKDELPNLQYVYTFNKVDKNEVYYWKNLLKDDKNLLNKISEIKKDISTDDLATLIYTSGTTGDPKGVMLTHNNIVSNVKACSKIMPVGKRHHVLSFLPLSHVFERMVSYLYMYVGSGIYYAQSIDTISDDLKDVKPHFFSTVPRLLEKVYDKIYKKGLSLSGIQKSLFFWALNLGLEYDFKGKGLIYKMKLAVANKIIFSKWREALGGNVIGVVSGGAALQPRLAKVFWAAKIPVVEGYGLTETSPVIAVNRFDPKYCRFGTVGQPIEGVEVDIAPDGEIKTRGPHIMKGYYNKPDKTKEAIDEKGYFYTGDIGELDENNFLKITDRKKEMFKTSGGKYIAPQAVENKFKESPFIEQVLITGENQRFPAALIVPNFEHLKNWMQQKGIQQDSNENIVKKQEIIDRIQREVDKLNENFSQYEKIKKFALLPDEWSVDAGELTHTQKLKRRIILDKYKEYWEPLYEEQ